ncbi:MAG: DUF4384 domain-containing protein [Proteobacteria bacterium]|nr:DUF4384 domain-containing protein [Pseudomonadota bacterium]MCP4918006.1 DUF4384 domain-containing protein [Pseudomonadota bacterium]
MTRFPYTEEGLNDGSRPDRVELARRLTGELDRTDDPAEAALLAEVEAAAPGLAAFDWEILGKAANRLDADEERTTERLPDLEEAPTPWWRRWWLVPALVAALMLVVVVIPDDPYRGAKGEAEIDFMVMRDGTVQPGDETAVFHQGDRLQFSYRTTGLSDVVLVSVDGAGTLSVFYPQDGDQPLDIIPGERHFLEGSIELDGAPGPEVFVAVFGAGSVDEARELVRTAYGDGDHDAVEALGDLPGVDSLRIEKSE